jgi:purine-binding chemotaxis protein CheW
LTTRYVSFLLGAGHYCVPVDEVLQIVRPEGIMEVPHAAPFVTGVINIRGDVVPVVDLKRRFGTDETQGGNALQDASGGRQPEVQSRAVSRSASRARVVVVRSGNRLCGLEVDDVREIVAIEESIEEAAVPEAQEQFVRGVRHRDGSLFLILDLQRILGAGRDFSAAGPS